MLMAARSSIILLTAALGLLMAAWDQAQIRRWAGPPGGCVRSFRSEHPLRTGHYPLPTWAPPFSSSPPALPGTRFLVGAQAASGAAGILVGFAIGTKFSGQ